MPGIKTKPKTGSYAGGTKAQVQGKSQNKSQQDLKSMSDDYANSGAALRAVTPVGNQSYTDFQKTRKTPAGQKQKEDYETTNKLPRLTDADYQQRMFDSGINKVKEKANSNPTQSVFTPQARDAAYGAQNKTSMEMGDQVSGSNGKVVDAASLADRSKRMTVSSAYAAPGMNIKSNVTGEENTPTKKVNQLAMYKDGTKGIKTKKSVTAETDAKNEKAKPSKMAYEDKPSMKQLEKGSKTYQNGSKGIKTKKSGMSNFINGESDKVKNMSDKSLDKAIESNMNFTVSKQNALEDGLITEKVNRKWKKQGGYADGTKGIKTIKDLKTDSELDSADRSNEIRRNTALNSATIKQTDKNRQEIASKRKSLTKDSGLVNFINNKGIKTIKKS